MTREAQLQEALNDLVFQWGNRDEATSLAEWDKRMKEAIEKAKPLVAPVGQYDLVLKPDQTQ